MLILPLNQNRIRTSMLGFIAAYKVPTNIVRNVVDIVRNETTAASFFAETSQQLRQTQHLYLYSLAIIYSINLHFLFSTHRSSRKPRTLRRTFP